MIKNVILIATMVASSVAAASQSAQPPNQRTQAGPKQAPSSEAKRTGAQPTTSSSKSSAPEASDPKSSDAHNACVCRDLEQRASGWDRSILQFAKQQNKAEIDLLNCQMREKDHKTLPHECDQYKLQMSGAEEWLEKSKHGKEEVRALWEKYRCQ